MNVGLPKLSELLEADRILELGEVDKPTALRLLCDRMAGNPRVLDPAIFHEAVVRREEQASTGVGLGVAIPHVKIPQVTDYVMAVARARNGVDFEAIDGKPVRLIFMIGASDRQTREFVKILAQVTRMLKDESARKELLDAEMPDAFIDAIRRHEGF